MEKGYNTQEQEQIKKGFNQGYLLAQHRPEFIEAIKSNKEGEKTPYFKAVLSGAKQYEKDKPKEKLKTKTQTKQPQKQKQFNKSIPKISSKKR